MGYSPDWDSLNFYLKDKGFKTEDIHRAGVLNVTKNDRAYDPLSGRIIVPIVNMAGNVVAFGGRIFNGEDAAKYKIPSLRIFSTRAKICLQSISQKNASRRVDSNT